MTVEVALLRGFGGLISFPGENANRDRRSYIHLTNSRKAEFIARPTTGGSSPGQSVAGEFTTLSSGEMDFLPFFTQLLFPAHFIVNALYYGKLLQALMLFSFEVSRFRGHTDSLWHKAKEDKYCQFLIPRILESMLRYTKD